jgi:hypothetical protein
MKLPTFRRDAAAGLATAQGKLAAAEARLAELASERALALAESDDVAVVQKIDERVAAAQSEAGVLKDRIATLQQAVREQQAEQTDMLRQKAIGEIERRLADQVKLAGEVEAAVKHLGEVWTRLLSWRGAILAKWPAELPLPKASDFEDVRQLRRELATALFAAGRPAWDREPSIPAPASPIGVQGLEPRGLAGAVAIAGQSFIARLKAQPVDVPEGEQAA